MTAAAIPAAGRGTRFGSDIPKQFLEIGEKPVLIRSVGAFPAIDAITLCIVAA